MPKYSHSTQLDSLNTIRMSKFKEWDMLGSAWNCGTMQWKRGGEVQDSVGYDLGGPWESDRTLRLKYRHKASSWDEGEELDYQIRMEPSPCHYGGQRWWFRCPVVGCGRRCTVLYERGKYFTCRKCTRCWYDSQNWVNQRFRLLGNLWKSDEYYETKVKRKYYRGRPTRQYRRYLKLSTVSAHLVALEESRFEQGLRGTKGR